MNVWDDIKNRFSCLDIANQYGLNLNPAKKKMVCPFCQYKKNPSFYLTEDYFIGQHFDPDSQGHRYIEKYALDFYEQGAEVFICSLDEDTDLADFIRDGGEINHLKKTGIFEVVSQLGWFKNQFVLTDRIIGGGVGSGENLEVYYKGSLTSDAFSKQGDLQKWVTAIKKIGDLDHTQIARFCIYAGFASIVWKDLNFSPVIIHLYSNTSKGKTTVLQLVSSIFGNPRYGKGMVTWDVTDKYITRYLEYLQNVPLCIDKLTSKNMRNFQSVIYAIPGDVSRGKASRFDPFDISVLRNFSTLVFSNGEPPMLSQ